MAAGLASIGNMFTTTGTTAISTMSEEYWRYMQSQAQMQRQYALSGEAMVAMKQEPNPVLLLLED